MTDGWTPDLSGVVTHCTKPDVRRTKNTLHKYVVLTQVMRGEGAQCRKWDFVPGVCSGLGLGISPVSCVVSQKSGLCIFFLLALHLASGYTTRHMANDPIINTRAKRAIPVARPSVGWREAIAVARTVASGWISQGRKVAEFEEKFAASHGRVYGSACSSGTTALMLALRAAGVGPGDAVLCPTFTMVAVPNSIVTVGAVPVFYDSSDYVGNTSLAKIARKHRTDMSIKAVIVAHCYGEVCDDMAAIADWCRAHELVLIEDCAEVHYAAGAGKYGDLVCWSFYANKNITTGEGGMVTTNSASTKDKLDRIRMHAFTPGRHFWHTEHAYGVRMTEMQAAIGLVQMSRAPDFMGKRRMLRALYQLMLEDVSVLIPATSSRSAWWVMPIVLPTEDDRDSLRAWLAEAGIETRTYFQPMHLQSHLRQYVECGDLSHSEGLGECGLYLPMYPAMAYADVVYVCRAVKGWDLSRDKSDSNEEF